MLDSCYYAAVIAGLATGRQAIARSTLAHRFVILLSAPGSPPGYARFQRAGLEDWKSGNTGVVSDSLEASSEPGLEEGHAGSVRTQACLSSPRSHAQRACPKSRRANLFDSD